MLAEENSQEVWIRVVQNASRFEPRGTVLSWIMKITKNLALNTIDKRGWEEELPPDQEANLEFDQEGLGAVLEKAQDLKKLKSAVARLPERQRVVLALWMEDEKSYSDLADELKLNVNAVKVLLFRAKENLLKQLKEDL